MSDPVASEGLAPDVLVLGGGAAGLLAAVAARRAGRSVVVLRKADGATVLSSGAIDVADAAHDLVAGAPGADPLAAGESVARGVDRLAALRPRHPYARADQARARVDEAVGLLCEVAADLEWSPPGEANLVVPTQLGTVKRAARAQGTLAADLATLDDGAKVVVVELGDVAGFDAGPVQQMLAWVGSLSAKSLDVRSARVAAEAGEPAAGARAFAARLDAGKVRDTLVAEIAKAARAAADDAPACVLLPAALGVDKAAEIHAALEAACGCPVAELASMPQSAPGVRLSRALLAGAERDGVVVRKADAVSSHTEGGRVVEVRARTSDGEQTFAPKAVVLATGRYLAGGLVRDGYAIEPIFGLPVFAEGKPVADRFIGTLTADRSEGEHAIFRAGVTFDAQLRPRTEAGAVFAENLFAAGSVLEGYDPARDASGLGVAAVTGLLAGEGAAAAAASSGD
jgi:glycerol-3-phosphate dehydrogenase subunit B